MLEQSGVYRIRNKQTGDVYIGSAKHFGERWRRHRKDLKNGKHHSIILKRAWEKYGADSFVFEVVELCEPEQLCERENHYLHEIRPVYNICPNAYCQIGRKLSDEHKEKITKYVRENNVRPPACTYEQKRRKVAMLDKSTNEEIARFESLSEACRFVGRNHTFVSCVSAVCNGKRQSIFGYKWQWV